MACPLSRHITPTMLEHPIYEAMATVAHAEELGFAAEDLLFELTEDAFVKDNQCPETASAN